jgi:gentisate 1,2-dioxygenase
VLAGETVAVDPNATSLVFYVVDGSGIVSQGDTGFRFTKGDFFAFPGGTPVNLVVESTTRLYYVNDAPLLNYMGTRVQDQRFRPTHYPAARAEEELKKVSGAAGAGQRNRISILLGNTNFPQTRTVTHMLWAMDWSPGMVFVTPPGYWHSHYNESDENCYVIPIQDAGLQTWLRSLDIRFAK